MPKCSRIAILLAMLILGRPAGAQTSPDYDPRADALYRRYLAATIIGVAGGVVGLLLIYRQGQIAAKTAAALANIERGWLLVSSIEPVSVQIPPNENAPACTFICYLKNF